MALSPVVTTTASSSAPSNQTLNNPQILRTVSSPLKNLASGSGQTSTNGTPKPALAPSATAPPTSSSATTTTNQPLAPTLDLAEQMNEEEKRKYVKGKKLGEGTYAIVFLGHLRSSPSTRVHELERVAQPAKRITAREMLQHRWWHSEPKPTRKDDLPRKDSGAGEDRMGLEGRRPGVVADEDRGAKVARKLDFGQR
ncbi:hypothetical protein M440DRAFT_1453566 [Trichoderma longibrachiatum ATCC 18648]|uniref:Protein kinase domain-containing protein n=1 Tax=Trichoderma longibrachiatum ATCC 18648 TaxID=983965 RepID=A0A2T4CE36_TRILO|nr:hypothetical protein M440DRAFT_1453566 [Trichoderma longibrachiatum ATCC 18648]